MSNPLHTNLLAGESSPYLLQHAHNPVEWFPWGEQAFRKARDENRPIFLSIGYSTCYWCHVMERQCFENEVIAEQMNRRFVNIKVDREQRPDVDQLYMTALQLMTQQGGWPMSLFLTPDLRPFFGGTYFPAADAYGRPGFPRILSAVEEAYRNRGDDVRSSAGEIVEILRRLSRPPGAKQNIRIDSAWVQELIDRSTSDFDPDRGGFGSAPKFPRETLLELILMFLRTQSNAELSRMIKLSLDAMAHGGIRDQLGGGFHRYSTDANWLVPHFEIMLYDNAMLLWIYAESHRQTGSAVHAAVARGIADFVLREMTNESGGFFTALDAEVDAEEGGSYLWTREQVQEALAGKVSEGEIARFARAYGLDDGPNFADPHHGNGVPDRNVLFIAETSENSPLLDAEMLKTRDVLYEARRRRKQPMLDRKVLTHCNALMIRGLAHAGTVLKEERLIHAAEKCADFLLAHHRDSEGGLLHGSVGGSASQRAFLDDYAFLIQALLCLPGTNRRDQAEELSRQMRERFWEAGNGGFFYTDERAADLIVRQMVGSDSPLPSGNGVAAMAMLELGDASTAARTLTTFAGQMQSAGESMSALVQAALLYVQQIGDLNAAATKSDRPLAPAELAHELMQIETAWKDSTHLSVKCAIRDGYHVQAHDAKPPLAPTRLTVNGAPVRQIEYPQSPSGVYEGEFEILVHFKRAPEAGEALELVLSYQACDESACLPTVVKIATLPS